MKDKRRLILQISEIDRRVWAGAFWWSEVESELRHIGRTDFKFRQDSDREGAMRMIETMRQQGVYPHEFCNDDCKARGRYTDMFIVITVKSCLVQCQYKGYKDYSQI